MFAFQSTLSKVNSSEETTIFNKIIELSKEKNREKLEQFLDEHKVFVDFRLGLWTPMMKLAYEDDDSTVEFLLNSVHAALDDIRAGANEAAKGYGAAGKIDKVKEMQKLGADRMSLLQAFAMAGETALVQEIIIANEKLTKTAIKYYAFSGHVEIINSMISSASEEEALEITINAVTGYGWNANIKEIERLLELYSASSESIKNLLFEAKVGLARGGFEISDALMQKEHDIRWSYLPGSYIRGGYWAEALKMLSGYNLNEFQLRTGKWITRFCINAAENFDIRAYNRLTKIPYHSEPAIGGFQVAFYDNKQFYPRPRQIRALLLIEDSLSKVALGRGFSTCRYLNPALKDAENIQWFMQKKQMSFSLAYAWEMAKKGQANTWDVLFYNHMPSPLPLALLLSILGEWISGISPEKISEYLNRYRDVPKLTAGWKSPTDHSLMLRVSFFGCGPRPEAFISHEKLQNFFNDYTQATQYNEGLLYMQTLYIKMDLAFKPKNIVDLAVENLQELLKTKKAIFNYAEIHEAINPDLLSARVCSKTPEFDLLISNIHGELHKGLRESKRISF